MINGPRIVQYDLIVYQPMYGYTIVHSFVDKIKVDAHAHAHVSLCHNLLWKDPLFDFLKVILQE